MAGVDFALTLQGMAEVERRLSGLAQFEVEDVAFDIGGLLESSTDRRIAEEKTAPDGTPWAPWSEGYAATRSERHSLLVGEGDLRESVQNYSSGDEARVGTNLVYGAIHQFGGAEVGSNIPARPYLGLSDDDRDEIRALVIGDLDEAVS